MNGRARISAQASALTCNAPSRQGRIESRILVTELMENKTRALTLSCESVDLCGGERGTRETGRQAERERESYRLAHMATTETPPGREMTAAGDTTTRFARTHTLLLSKRTHTLPVAHKTQAQPSVSCCSTGAELRLSSAPGIDGSRYFCPVYIKKHSAHGTGQASFVVATVSTHTLTHTYTSGNRCCISSFATRPELNQSAARQMRCACCVINHATTLTPYLLFPHKPRFAPFLSINSLDPPSLFSFRSLLFFPFLP